MLVFIVYEVVVDEYGYYHGQHLVGAYYHRDDAEAELRKNIQDRCMHEVVIK